MLIEGDAEQAKAYFQQAWDEAETDFEKLVAAHYLARVQPTLEDVLYFNMEALRHGELIKTEKELQSFFPSLYLNVGKSYEDLGEKAKALHYYKIAAEHIPFLAEDGFGNMIKNGILNGLKRVV